MTEAPIIKHQISNKFQISNSKAERLDFGICVLEFEIYKLCASVSLWLG